MNHFKPETLLRSDCLFSGNLEPMFNFCIFKPASLAVFCVSSAAGHFMYNC